MSAKIISYQYQVSNPFQQIFVPKPGAEVSFDWGDSIIHTIKTLKSQGESPAKENISVKKVGKANKKSTFGIKGTQFFFYHFPMKSNRSISWIVFFCKKINFINQLILLHFFQIAFTCFVLRIIYIHIKSCLQMATKFRFVFLDKTKFQQNKFLSMHSENSPTACCGRCSIETATNVSAVICFVFEIIFAAYSVFFFYLVGWLFGLFVVFCAFSYLLVIYAQNERNPNLFAPCLIIEGIRLIFSMWFSIRLLVSATWPGQERVNDIKDMTGRHYTIESSLPFIIANFIFWSLSTALICSLYFIILRGFIALRKGLHSGRLAPPVFW